MNIARTTRPPNARHLSSRRSSLTTGFAMTQERRLQWLLALTCIVLSLVAAIVTIKRDPPFHSVFDVNFGFGVTVAAILQKHQFGMQEMEPQPYWTYAHRLPFVPFFLSGLTLIFRSFTLVVLVKDALCALLWFYAVRRLLLRHCIGALGAFILIGLLYLVPLNFLTVSQIDTEESYLFFMLTALAATMFTRREGDYWKVSLLIAAMYLTKSSLALVCFVSAVWVIWQDRGRPGLRLLSFVPLAALLISILSWGSYIYLRTGVFAVGVNASSYNGMNLYKGNNPRALALYPRVNLDSLDEIRALEPPTALGIHDEWTKQKWQLKMGEDFIHSHPSKVLAMDLQKLKVMLYDVGPSPQTLTGIKPGAELCLAVDHLMFTLAVLLALRRRDANAAWFGLLVVAYIVPFLAGFLYQRHMMPLYGLAFIYCGVAWADRARAGSSAVVSRSRETQPTGAALSAV
jgi:hypothetical protein